MAKYLVIVESPAKVKTIKKFLGANYEVMASNGHVRDLPKSQLGFSPENDFEPKYITIRGKGDILAALRKEVKKAEKVYLATDPDREGEAISWHLYYALKLESKKVYRITFNEITKTAVKEALKNPREIDMNLVDAQQVRRVLDRMVGYRISPVLWEKVKRGLSAGRVQSAALRMICDREEEINAFVPEEYWTLDAVLHIAGEKKPLTAKYHGHGEKKTEIKNEKQLQDILKALQDAKWRIVDKKSGERTKKAPLPFTTSTLQQEASKVLNFSTQKTMRIAQQLYEGVDIKGNGTAGIITYLRTDSTRISEEASEAAAKFIEKKYGAAYVGGGAAEKKNGRKIQDAHEAIRPTDIERTPADLKDSLSREQFRLYQLIWKRFAASRMSAALYETTSVKIDAAQERFTVSANKLKFDGFLSVYVQEDDREETAVISQNLDKDTELELQELQHKQHFTQPPAHYTEASLVRALEEQGIGRPSTYAPTLTTLLARRYIVKENKNIYVTEIGEVVDKMMREAFPTIVDVSFTANMEALLDGVELGEVEWKTIIRNFYPDLDEAVKEAEKKLEEVEIKDELSEEFCDICGRQMVIKYGPLGRFLACPGFPDCKNTKPYFEKIGVNCPKCGKDIVMKKTRKGRKYYGCIDNPDCDFMVWQKPSGVLCEKCGSMMVEKGSKLVCSGEGCGNVIDQKERKAASTG